MAPRKCVRHDEIWSFVYSKAKNVPEKHKGEFGYGDVWTWTAIDADTKLVPSWFVGQRTVEDGFLFLMDLKGRLANRVQLTTDGLGAYSAAIRFSFGTEVDWAVLQKTYGADPAAEKRYSPPICTGMDIRVKRGRPDPTKISTSYVERQNLTMRMNMRLHASDQRLLKEGGQAHGRYRAALHALQLRVPAQDALSRGADDPRRWPLG